MPTLSGPRFPSNSLLYHYSEDPGIELFEPRPGRQIEGRPPGESLVWAIDAHHSPAYYFPRDCPRIVLWPIEGSTEADVAQWMGDAHARMVAHIESVWLDRFEECELYRYAFERAGFEDIHDHGVHVSAHSVRPIDVTSVGSLKAGLEAENVELRVVDTLQPLADAWFSTLHFSGFRLRNATEWVAPV